MDELQQKQKKVGEIFQFSPTLQAPKIAGYAPKNNQIAYKLYSTSKTRSQYITPAGGVNESSALR